MALSPNPVASLLQPHYVAHFLSLYPLPFHAILQAKLNEYEFPVNKVANVQSQLSRLIEKNYYLNKSAREVGAFSGFAGSCHDIPSDSCRWRQEYTSPLGFARAIASDVREGRCFEAGIRSRYIPIAFSLGNREARQSSDYAHDAIVREAHFRTRVQTRAGLPIVPAGVLVTLHEECLRRPRARPAGRRQGIRFRRPTQGEELTLDMTLST